MPICRHEQLVQQHRTDDGVVVQNQDEVGTTIERVADAEVVAARVSEITARLDDLDRQAGFCAPQCVDRSVSRTVVDDDDPSLDVMQLAQ